MTRCLKYGEDECHGHDCMDRVGTPCIFDSIGRAGTEDIDEQAADIETSPHHCDICTHVHCDRAV